MGCQAVQVRLNAMVDGEKLPGWRAYAASVSHGLACPRCRAAWRRLRRERRRCRGLAGAAPPAELRAGVLAALDSLPAPDASTLPSRGPARRITAALAAGAAAAAAAVFLLWNARGSEAMAARIRAAVQRANTWHLYGWREEPTGRR